MATQSDEALIPDDDPVLVPAVITEPHELAPADKYTIKVTPLKGRSRRADWQVASSPPSTAIDQPDFVVELRRFFAAMDGEVDRYKHDPIATASALVRLEALLADVRYLRDRLKATTADSLDALQVRRLTIDSVCTVEASSEIKRSNWQHAKLLALALERCYGGSLLNGDTGEYIDRDEMAAALLAYFTPEWRLTALRDDGIEPDDYCDIDRDERNRIVKTPTVRIVDNRIRGHK